VINSFLTIIPRPHLYSLPDINSSLHQINHLQIIFTTIPNQPFLYQTNPSFSKPTLPLPNQPFLYQTNLSFTKPTLPLPNPPFLYQTNPSFTKPTPSFTKSTRFTNPILILLNNPSLQTNFPPTCWSLVSWTPSC